MNIQESFKKLLIAGSASTALNISEAMAADLNKLALDADPYQVSLFLRDSSLLGGDNFETAVVTAQKQNGWLSRGVGPNDSTGASVEIHPTIKEVWSNLLPQERHRKYITHNHSAELFKRYSTFFGIPKSQIVNANKVLSGPSLSEGGIDCTNNSWHLTANPFNGFFASYAFINILVEPGGTWFCRRSNEKKDITWEEEVKLRKALILASQTLGEDELSLHVKLYIKTAKSLAGTEIIFLKAPYTKDEYNRALSKIESVESGKPLE